MSKSELLVFPPKSVPPTAWTSQLVTLYPSGLSIQQAWSYPQFFSLYPTSSVLANSIGSTFRIHPEPDHLPPSPRPPSQSVHRAFISTTSILVFCHHIIFTQWPEYSCYICLRSPGSSAQTPPKSPTSEGLRSLSLSTTLPQLSRTSPRTTIRNPICSSPYPSTPVLAWAEPAPALGPSLSVCWKYPTTLPPWLTPQHPSNHCAPPSHPTRGPPCLPT